MISDNLKKAREFEETHLPCIKCDERPAFHLTGGLGWINDPNGFSSYKGEYHMFYQYHPFSNVWGPMHWGHAKSRDMLTWERLPIVLAPDEEYDELGCFSGSAWELDDGRHMLMYTGVSSLMHDRSWDRIYQSQCIAVGDGVNYEKCSNNPVIRPEDMPFEIRVSDFRDPKLWREADGTWRMVASVMNLEKNCRIVLLKSSDAVHWEFCASLIESTKALGGMWECPDFFMLDGKQVMLVSPMAMQPDDDEFHVGHNTMALIGSYNPDTYEFDPEEMRQVDNGIDFYAPQTMLTPDGRRIMIGWMQAWPNSKFVPPGVKYFGQLSLPRELSIRGGKLCQEPVRELLEHRRNPVIMKDVRICEDRSSSNGKGFFDIHSRQTAFPGIEGRMIDMTVTVRELRTLKKLNIRVAADQDWHTDVSYIPKHEILKVDRNHSGYLYDIVHRRDMHVVPSDGILTLRFIMDRHSLEVFINGGERTATVALFTPQEAKGIFFSAEGETVIDIEKYDLVF
ncbi:MAG: GH32 C-terminal domain-containing protein [Lachnospiraceae bacterium]|nr:GH32 C-terminal domain-containing protein [Lachnospiraceae bacterium]